MGRSRTHSVPFQVGASALAEVTCPQGSQVWVSFLPHGITQTPPFFASPQSARRYLVLLRTAPLLNKVS